MVKLDIALVFGQEFAVWIRMEISNEDKRISFKYKLKCFLIIFSLDKLIKEEVSSCIFEKQMI